MANRTMQAKTLKLQRQLRKLPRRIEDPPGEFTKHSGTEMPARLKAEGVSGKRTPNRELIGGYKHRANSLKTSMQEADELVLGTYGRLFIGTPPGKQEAQERMFQMYRDRTDPSVDKLLRYVKCRITRG
jgi:hypothetical protein